MHLTCSVVHAVQCRLCSTLHSCLAGVASQINSEGTVSGGSEGLDGLGCGRDLCVLLGGDGSIGKER